jgi:hypothetical protein
MNTLNLNEIRDTIQDCNINFLIGSGMSTPYLEILGNVEVLLSILQSKKLRDKERKIIEASLYKKYFDGVIVRNIEILENSPSSLDVFNAYKAFLQSVNSILLNRKSTILSKEVNISTTNVDIFLEKALDDLGLEYNDGFCGRFSPVFSLNNFKKCASKKSLHYDNTSQIPVFNLLKLHGSLTWERKDEAKNIKFSQNLDIVKSIKDKKMLADSLIEIERNSTIDDLVTRTQGVTTYRKRAIEEFLNEYKKLSIINPTKEKFKHSLLNQTYYDLLRIYSNELEKENTVLFAMGFSFDDEHIRDLTLRAADSNPTLTIYIFAHTTESKGRFETKLNLRDAKNKNVKIIQPPRKKIDDNQGEVDKFEFNLQKINEEIFAELLKKIEEKDTTKI